MVLCKLCKLSIGRLKADAKTKCKGSCAGVYHKNCAEKIKGFTNTQLCDECQDSPIPKAGHSINLEVAKATPEKILAAVNEKLAIVFNMKNTLEEMADDISFYAQKYQELVESKAIADKKIKALEHKNVHLEICNKALEERVAYLEIKEKENNVELYGLQGIENESVESCVKKIADQLGMDHGKISEIKWVGANTAAAVAKKQRDNSARAKPRPVVITLSTRDARNQWLATRKTHKLTNDDVFENGDNQRIYVNEDLTNYTRNLLWTAKNELKSLFRYIWVQNGRVLMRKDDPQETKIRVIRTLHDINKYTIQNEEDE